MLRYICTLALILFYQCTAAGTDYNLYHKGIINAETEIFLNHNPAKGLAEFKRVFDGYDFVYVDDCIEAFQLALFYKQDNIAMAFIKKAIANGFELKLLGLLNCGCPCDFHMCGRKKVTVFNSFIEKNKAALEAYSDECYVRYVRRIDKKLLAALVDRHVKEQLFKNYHKELGMNPKDQTAAYNDICNDNLHYMDSLAARKIYLGERNLGIYTNKLAGELKLSFGTVEHCASSYLRYYNCPSTVKIPFNDENEYFEINPVYNMQFHNAHSYEVLYKYKDDAVKAGYVHPREFASLRYNSYPNQAHNDLCLYLADTLKKITETKLINEKRAQLLLPSYELDYSKHVFAHRNELQLFFGFFNGTR